MPAVVVAAAGPEWQSLTPAQKDALAPLRRDWPEIEPARRQMWLQIANLFPNLPPDERNRVQARMEDWARLSPAERGQARLNFRETRRISAEQRAALWDAYLALPPEQREALAQRARSVPPAAPATAQRPVAGGSNAGSAAARPAALLAPVPATSGGVQARPGASTTLVTKSPTTPARATDSLPILIPPGMIDRTTLLPQPPPKKPKATRTAAAAAPAAAAASASAADAVSAAAPAEAGAGGTPAALPAAESGR